MLRKFFKGIWPAKPIRLQRERDPAPVQADLDLAAQEPAITPTEIEQCIQQIRDHADRQKRRQSDERLTQLLALDQAQRFCRDCLDYGPTMVKAGRLERAFTIWSRSQDFDPVAESDFRRAMEDVLAWRGGHRGVKEGTPVYIGCSLRAEVVESISKASQAGAGARITIDQSSPE
jgi:hypothetical protein